jgi:hypothetical protein
MRAAALLMVLLCSACVVEQPPPPHVAVSTVSPLQSAAPPGPARQGCREFNTPVVIGGQEQSAYGTACLQPDGSWKIEQSLAGQPPQTYVVPPQVYQPYYPPNYMADPWFYGPPLFVGGVFVGGGWGFAHHHGGWHGAWRGGFHGRRY